MVIWIVALAILCTVAGFFLGFGARGNARKRASLGNTGRLPDCFRVSGYPDIKRGHQTKCVRRRRRGSDCGSQRAIRVN